MRSCVGCALSYPVPGTRWRTRLLRWLDSLSERRGQRLASTACSLLGQLVVV
jgi:hypothetical protein